jgi:tetratricopeptide (TPR) repeat protein
VGRLGVVPVLAYWAGDFARALPLYEAESVEAERLGRLARAARGWSYIAALRVALGDITGAQASVYKAEALAARLGRLLPQLFYAKDSMACLLDSGWEQLASALEAMIATPDPGLAWARGPLHAVWARALARVGRTEEALTHVGRIRPWLERAPAWANTFPVIPCHGAEALWLAQRPDDAEVIEQALRDKVVGPDFRLPNVDGRLSLARLCALTDRPDEATSWWADARRVLTEQGAVPLLAICDHDEALMHHRRGEDDRARPLLAAAHEQFAALGMVAWTRRTQDLLGETS